MAESNKRPIYITGSPRSGTSAMVMAIKKATDYPGYSEGLVLGMLDGINHAIENGYTTCDSTNENFMISKVDKDQLRKDIFDIYKNRIEDLFQGHDIWIDKTVSVAGASAVPCVKMIWPKTKVIFMKRRPIETMISRIKKFPKRTFEVQCKNWSKIMNSWLLNREKLTKDEYIEVDQREMSLDSKKVAHDVATYLGLDQDQEKILAKAFSYDRPEYSGGDENVVISLDKTGWTPEQKKIFRDTCGEVASKFNYSLDDKYYLDK